jgi:hypothetical protein
MADRPICRIRRCTRLRLATYPITFKPPPLSTAIERVPSELFVDQLAEQQVIFIDLSRLLSCIDRRTGHAGQNALLYYRHRFSLSNPPWPDHDRLIPDFF